MIVLACSLTDQEVGARIVEGPHQGVIEAVESPPYGMVRVVIDGERVLFFPQEVLTIDRRPAVAALLRANTENTLHLLMGALASTPKGVR